MVGSEWEGVGGDGGGGGNHTPVWTCPGGAVRACSFGTWLKGCSAGRRPLMTSTWGLGLPYPACICTRLRQRWWWWLGFGGGWWSGVAGKGKGAGERVSSLSSTWTPRHYGTSWGSFFPFWKRNSSRGGTVLWQGWVHVGRACWTGPTQK